jgi:glycosyltransferase involved in cell wall biosynthesis
MQPDDSIVGWGPTISEINNLAASFDHIYHVAFLHETTSPPSSLPYTANNVTFIPLPPVGGKSFLAKLNILLKMPKTLAIVRSTLRKVDAFQLRTPLGIGVYLIPYLTLFSKKKGWYKYAGNWNQSSPPLGYRLQRWFLKNQSRKVTINGKWKNQKPHCISFENPCLTHLDRVEGFEWIGKREFATPYDICFVGRLEDEKGVQRIIDAVRQLDQPGLVGTLHFIGNGPKLESYKKQCEANSITAIFYGFLNREAVFSIYKKCSFLLLPSTASEGFPKVIAEAMNFGCIPIVSNVSSIGQYITEENVYIVAPSTAEELKRVLSRVASESTEMLKQKAMTGYKTSSSFTFENYTLRIMNEILNS